jgi:FlaA1/EpsC-like NDP-sugar epimerase
MKVVLTGTTGHIGGEALKRCLTEPEIDSIVVLSRRELPEYENESRVKVIIMKSFTDYSTDTINAIADSDACIW